jgi:hypothetical protein
MPDLDTMLQQFASFIEDELPPPDVERLIHTGPTPPTEPVRRPPVVAFVAAASAVLAIGLPLLVFGAFSSTPVDEDPMSTTIVPVSTTTVASTTAALPDAAAGLSVAAAQASVSKLHDAWNSGDVEDVIDLLAPIAGTDPGMRDRIEQAIVALGVTLEAVCSDPVENPTDGFEVTCSVSLIDDRFYTTAGVSWTQNVTYTVTDAGIDTRSGFFWSQGPKDDAYEFLREFDSWLYERHEGGQAAIGWIWVDPDNGLLPNWLDGQPCCMYSVETLAAAEMLPGLVNDFLSDIGGTWPIANDPATVQQVGDLTLSHYPVDETYTVISATRGDNLLFTLTQCPGRCFAQDRRLTRSPDGVLSTVGYQGSVWKVNKYGQTEITHLWPSDTAFDMDVLWLTDYTGSTRDMLTGYTPDESDTFTLHDELVLETRTDGKGLFALHADCQTDGDDIGAALVSFEGEEPVVLIGWRIDYTTMRFSSVDDPSTIQIGGCYEPTARP